MKPGDSKPHSYHVDIQAGLYRGGLFELEQVTTFNVLDDTTGEVRLTLEGLMSASFDKESGMWGEAFYSGVSGLSINADGTSVSARYFDGREETLPIP